MPWSWSCRELRRSHRRQQRRALDAGADLRRDDGICLSAGPRVAKFREGVRAARTRLATPPLDPLDLEGPGRQGLPGRRA